MTHEAAPLFLEQVFSYKAGKNEKMRAPPTSLSPPLLCPRRSGGCQWLSRGVAPLCCAVRSCFFVFQLPGVAWTGSCAFGEFGGGDVARAKRAREMGGYPLLPLPPSHGAGKRSGGWGLGRRGGEKEKDKVLNTL